MNKMFMMNDNSFSMIAEISGDISEIIDKMSLPLKVVVLPTKNLVLFPGVMLPILTGKNSTAKHLKKAEKSGEVIGVPT